MNLTLEQVGIVENEYKLIPCGKGWESSWVDLQFAPEICNFSSWMFILYDLMFKYRYCCLFCQSTIYQCKETTKWHCLCLPLIIYMCQATFICAKLVINFRWTIKNSTFPNLITLVSPVASHWRWFLRKVGFPMVLKVYNQIFLFEMLLNDTCRQ